MTARAALVCLLLAAAVQPAGAYLQLAAEVDGDVVRLRWDNATPVRWFASDRGVDGVTAAEFQRAAARAFGTWHAVPTADIDAEFAGFTGSAPSDDDGISVLGFEYEPDMDRVLGATSFVVDVTTGAIVESDIFFNSAFAWSTAGSGDASRFDLESIAVHEIGHLFGLGHSALGETAIGDSGGRRVLAAGAVMFPIAFPRGSVADRVLFPDDVAGISDLYPAAGFRAATGALRGRITRDGRGVIGAHVVAFDPASGALVGGFTLDADGSFQIAGLRPGPHVVRVEPLDDADVESFFDPGGVDLDFRVTYLPRLFVAPPGGVGERVEIAVAPK